jgi:hypothetical protein
MVEAAMAVVLVSTMIMVGMNAVGSARKTLMTISDRAKATLLAEDMMKEILSKYYYDPQASAPTTIGTDSGETSRAAYDDVDDYDGKSYSPPTYADGSSIAGFDSSWTVSVAVVWVDPTSPTTVKTSESGAKRITVTVKKGSQVLATLMSVRSRGWPGVDNSLYQP